MSKRCFYTLKLGNYYLAPRTNISVKEPSPLFDPKLLSDLGCACCGGDAIIDSWQSVFTVYYDGGGSLKTAWSMYNKVQTVLSEGCDSDLCIQLYRQVCDEDPQIYLVRQGYQRIINPEYQYNCRRVLAAEIVLTLETYVAADDYFYANAS